MRSLAALLRTAAARSPARALPVVVLAAFGIRSRSLRGLLAAPCRGCARPCLPNNGTGRKRDRLCGVHPVPSGQERKDEMMKEAPSRLAEDPLHGGANEPPSRVRLRRFFPRCSLWAGTTVQNKPDRVFIFSEICTEGANGSDAVREHEDPVAHRIRLRGKSATRARGTGHGVARPGGSGPAYWRTGA